MEKYIVEIEPVDQGPRDYDNPLYRIKGIDEILFTRESIDSFHFEKYDPSFKGRLSDAVLDKIKYESYEIGYRDGVVRGQELGRLESTAMTYEEALHDGRKIGRGEIWDAIKMLLTRDANQEYNHEFGGRTTPEIMRKYSPDEVIKALGKISEVDKVDIGDEVEIAGKKVVVTRIPENDPQRIHYIDASGRTYANNAYEEFKKTGRHFPIAELLVTMGVEV